MLVRIIILSRSVLTNLEVHSEYLLGSIGSKIHSLINNTLVSLSRKERTDLNTTSSLYVMAKFDMSNTIIMVYFSGEFETISFFLEYIVFIVEFIISMVISKFKVTFFISYSLS